jgi:hypothetical protein
VRDEFERRPDNDPAGGDQQRDYRSSPGSIQPLISAMRRGGGKQRQKCEQGNNRQILKQ